MLLRPGLPMPRRDFLSHVGLSQDRASSERRDFLPPVFLLPLGGGNVTPCLNFHSRIMQSLLSMMITRIVRTQACTKAAGIVLERPASFLRADEPAYSLALAVIVIHAHRKLFLLIHGLRPPMQKERRDRTAPCGAETYREISAVQFCLTNIG